MCGFGMDLIFRVAIGLVVILVLLALLKASFPNLLAWLTGGEYANIIRVVIGGVVAILILLFIWRLAECARLV